ncbi:DUF6029 family protein [Crocinitomix catalasitica]|uniref:DUF6029 family protein n=1 Tax=Crocinitomix catalasitica TaxID=184607 RepID=UPI0012F9D1CC|nr:DUF6029 family protein [Crocinitomix catalasitica]
MKKILLTCCLLAGVISYSQNPMQGGNVTGNAETNIQYLNTDTVIGAFAPEEKIVMNSYMNVNYSLGKFRAGVRFESYLPSTAGYPSFYTGSGIGYRYAQYAGDRVTVTAGNFYEQFGSGMILRAYEERALGLDNALDGASIKFRPVDGIEIKGLIGKQRVDFADGRLINSEGIVRGIDGSINLNELIPRLDTSDLRISIGGSLVSRYQSSTNDTIILPANVGSYGARIGIQYKNFYINGEYVIKDNDPNEHNGYIYNKGHGALINLGYSQKGLGILLTAKSIDNMSFRSDRTFEGNQAFINYLPATSNNHTYNLAGSLYPYATNLYGEVAYQLDVLYKIPKKSFIGGKYGTDLHLNLSVATDHVRHTSDLDFETNRISYVGKPFDMTDSLYNFDFNIHASRKLNKKWKASLHYFHFIYNNTVNKITDHEKFIKSEVVVGEVLYKINRKHSIRIEAQALFTEVDRGNWSTFLIEYTISPNWFFTIMDQYNYGNPDESLRLHYLLGSFGYTHNRSRFMFMYGKQRAGILCIGGVCRPVPATNGLTFTFTQSF